MNLVSRNLKVKYRGSFFGFFWSLITPILHMLIYTVVFSVIIRIKVEWPFAIFLLTAQLPWIFFSSSLQMGAGSIIEHGNLIKKVYFPRELLPISSVLSNLVSLGITLVILLLFILIYKIPITHHMLILPLAILILVFFTMGITFFLSALAVYFRDIFHIIEVVVLVWFWSAPVVYPMKLIEDLPQEYAWLSKIYLLNPMVSMLELFRFSFIYQSWPPIQYIGYSLIWSIASLLAGYYVFKRLENGFAREI